MLRRTHISQALVFCLVLGTFATLYPIRNATEQLNNKEASAYGSSHVKYVSLGDSHSCAVNSAGGVKCWGLNTSGQVGNSGAGSYPSTPVDVTGLTSGVSSVALGDTHSCVVTSGGGVKCWGSNSSGRLGDGTTTSRSTPVSVLASAGVELTGIVAVSAGSAHSCALTSTGGVKCWGGNTSGQLGNDSVTNSSTPVDVLTSSSPITPLSGVTAISVGGSYSCALMSNGTVKCWGDAAYGQLGNGNTNNQKTPVSVLASAGVDLSGVSAISTGTWHACALMSDGTVKCWGDNDNYQLGNNSPDSNIPVTVPNLSGVSGIAAGRYTSCALKSGGVQCWGKGELGTLGNNTTTGRSEVPVPVHTSSSDRTALSGVSTVAMGSIHVCALMNEGGLKCWGNNGSSQLGRGSMTPTETTPANVSVSGFSFGEDTTAPTFSAAAVNSAGTQVIVGFSEALSATTASLSAFSISVNGESRTPTAMSIVGSTVVLTTSPAITAGQTVTFSYTDPTAGNDANAIQDSSGNDASSIVTASVSNHVVTSSLSLGSNHSCAVASTGGVKCWGYGTYGQLGNNASGAFSERTTPVDVHTSSSSSTALSGVSAIALGSQSSCALTTDGGVKCWGLNNYGQGGYGTRINRSTPLDVRTSSSSSTALSGVTAIDIGGFHSCAVTATGGVKCWGWSGDGQLGDGSSGDNTWSTSPVDVHTSSTSNTPLSGVKAIALGYEHSCALTTAGGVKCWGDNNSGQLGNGSSGSLADRTTPVDVTGLSSGVSAIALGANHSCALTTTGGVKCWGSNYSGQLGNGSSGSSADRNTPVDVTGLTSGVAAIALGDTHSCALMTTGGVKCWGRGELGQLGNGSTTDRSTPVDVSVSGFSFGVDTTAPTFSSAATNTSGTTITLTYSEALSTTTAAGSDFAVLVGGVSRSVSGVAVSGSTVVLTLASPAVESGQSVSVAYTDPTGSNDTNALQDSAGNDAATLAATSVTNSSTVDTTGPTFVSAATNVAGSSVTLTFSESLSATTAGAGAFSVVVNGSAITPSSVSVSGSTVVLAITPAVQTGDAVTFTYTDPTNGNDTNAVQDTSGNDVGSISSTLVTNASTTDTRVPTFVSAVTNAAGTTITLTYSEALSAATAVGSDFTVLVGGVSRSVSGVAVSGSTVVLTLSSAVGAGQTVSVAYTDPTGSNDTNALQDAAGNDAATLAATSVTNSVPAPSSGGSPDPGTTTTTTTSTTVAPTATTTTTVAPTTATVRSVTTVPRRTTTTTAVNRTTTTTIRATTTTAFRPLEPLAPIVSTTTSVLSPTTSTAKASVTSVAISSIESLQQAEGRLKAVEAQTSTANNDLRIAQIKLGESIVAVLDPKSALAVAVNVAEEKVVSLSAASASAEQIAAAVAQLENLKIAISQNVSLSIERIAEAQSRLAAVLANPAATAEQVAVAKAELVSARVPDVGVVAEILTVANSDSHLQPVIIPGVVDNPGTGQFVLLDGATAKSIEITRINGTSLRMTSTDGFRLVISTRDKNGDPVQFNSRGGIVVKHGNLVSIAGEGFAPGTTAKTWLFSSPRELGNLNVSPDGSFAADFPITDDIRVGNHTAQVNGLSPDGEVRSLSLDVEILPNEGPAPYDPLANRLAVAALVAQAMALLALSRRKDNDGDDRDQADVSEVSVDHVVGSDGNKRDVYSPPVLQSLDQFLQRIPSRLATTQQLLARIVHDAVYLRALTGVGGAMFALTGIVVGFFAAQSADFAGQSPTFVWLAALVVLGSLDALSGGLAALTIVITTGIAGGLNSTDSVRGLLGLAVMCFAIPLVASTTRPFRRAASDSVDRLWKRASDLALIAVFGAWAAGAMYDALPGLYGFTSSAAGRTTTIQLLVLGTLVLRFGLESLATRVTGQRLTYLVGATLPDSTQGRTVLSILVRTIIMVFVAEAFIGNNIALWIGAGMYAIPKLIATRAEHFPKSALLKTWLPSGLLRTVVMLFVARWWASNISAFSEDPSTQLQAAFVLLGIPSLVLTSLGWFAGGGRKWRSTPVSKVLGIVVLAIGVLTVRGVLFA